MPSKTEGVGLGPAIDVHNLTKKFQQNIAVEDLTFHVDKGEVFGLLGPNGAGKTTTVRILCSLIPPTSGSVSIGGYDIANSGSYTVWDTDILKLWDEYAWGGYTSCKVDQVSCLIEVL